MCEELLESPLFVLVSPVEAVAFAGTALAVAADDFFLDISVGAGSGDLADADDVLLYPRHAYHGLYVCFIHIFILFSYVSYNRGLCLEKTTG